MERNGWSSPFRRSREDPMSAMRVSRLGTGTVPFFCHSSALWGSDVSGRKGWRYSPNLVEEEFSEVQVVLKAKEDPASCVKHENCLVSAEELIHLGPAVGLIAFVGCVDVLVRRVR